ncbi:MAG: hypothetical protein WCF84_18745 [Anaerolineae bacterium]
MKLIGRGILDSSTIVALAHHEERALSELMRALNDLPNEQNGVAPESAWADVFDFIRELAHGIEQSKIADPAIESGQKTVQVTRIIHVAVKSNGAPK